MKKIKSFLLLMLLSAASTAFAQSVTVNGTVTDAATGDPMSYASVVLKGTRTGVMTDLDGAYSITVPAGGTLVFSSIGYRTEEIVVGSRGTINVALEPDAEGLEDVLIVAYGTAKKESFTGSAQTIKSEQIEKRTVANVTKALDHVRIRSAGCRCHRAYPWFRFHQRFFQPAVRGGRRSL